MSLTLRKTAATAAAVRPPTLFNRLLRLKSPSTTTSRFISHRYHSSATTANNQTPDSDPEASKNPANKYLPPIMIKGSPQEWKTANPFQSGGQKNWVAVDEVPDGLLVRILLPGVGEDGCKVWVENDTVFFAGKGGIECENENCGRSYGGSMELNPELKKIDEIKSEMKHGILRMIVPKV